MKMTNCDICGEPRDEGMDCSLCKNRVFYSGVTEQLRQIQQAQDRRVRPAPTEPVRIVDISDIAS